MTVFLTAYTKKVIVRFYVRVQYLTIIAPRLLTYPYFAV